MQQWRNHIQDQKSRQIAEMLGKHRQSAGSNTQNTCLLQDLVQPAACHPSGVMPQTNLYVSEALLVSVLNGTTYATPLEKKRLLQCVHNGGQQETEDEDDGIQQMGMDKATLMRCSQQQSGQRASRRSSSMGSPRPGAQHGKEPRSNNRPGPEDRLGCKKERSRPTGKENGTVQHMSGAGPMKGAYGRGKEDITRTRRQRAKKERSPKPNLTWSRAKGHGKPQGQDGKVSRNQRYRISGQVEKTSNGASEIIEDDSQ